MDSLKISKVVATIQMGILKIDEKNVKKKLHTTKNSTLNYEKEK